MGAGAAPCRRRFAWSAIRYFRFRGFGLVDIPNYRQSPDNDDLDYARTAKRSGQAALGDESMDLGRCRWGATNRLGARLMLIVREVFSRLLVRGRGFEGFIPILFLAQRPCPTNYLQFLTEATPGEWG